MVPLNLPQRSESGHWIAISGGLPIKKGRGGAMIHDYKRTGTTTLFAGSASLQVLSCRNLALERITVPGATNASPKLHFVDRDAQRTPVRPNYFACSHHLYRNAALQLGRPMHSQLQATARR